MADKDESKADKQEAEPLTEEQRIAKLEKNLGTSKTVMMVVALLMVMVISVGVTAFVVFVGKGSSKQGNELTAQVSALQEEITSLQAKLEEQALQLNDLKTSVPELSKQINNSGNGVIISLLSEQEESNQIVLNAARSSIYDLAHMVPGSRTWLEVYSEQIDLALAHSKNRQVELRKLTSGGSLATPIESASDEDDGFGDF